MSQFDNLLRPYALKAGEGWTYRFGIDFTVKAREVQRESGAPRRITASQITKLVQLAEHSPQEVGLPYGRWSLRKLSVYLVKQNILKSLGRERLRQLLKKRCTFPAGAAQVVQPGPTATGNSGSPALNFQAFAHR